MGSPLCSQREEQVQDASMGRWRLDRQEDLPTKRWSECFLTWDLHAPVPSSERRWHQDSFSHPGLKGFPPPQGLSEGGSLHQKQGDEEGRGAGFQEMVDRTPT